MTRAADGSVLALVTDAFGGHGGISQYNRDLLRALDAGALGPIIVLPRLGGEPDDLQPPASVVQLRPLHSRLGYAVRALSVALRQQPSVVFCGHLFMAPLAALIARLVRAKLVVQLHGIEAWGAVSDRQTRAVAAADLVLCVSRDTKEHALRWSGVRSERVSVIGNTFSSRFTPGDRIGARRRFGLGDEPIILTVGRLAGRDRGKGHDEVLEALTDERLRDATYVIAGSGPDRSRLEEVARRNGVADRVRFLGRVDAHDLPDVYRAGDLFAMPSVGEGFGIVFIEAMACGTPALGLAVAGARDALDDGRLGIICELHELVGALYTGLNGPRSDPAALSAAVNARFGRPVFDAAVARAWRRLTDERQVLETRLSATAD